MDNSLPIDNNVFNADLVEDLARRRAVVFVGAGVTASATTSAGTKVRQWESFLRHVGGKLTDQSKDQVLKLIDQREYPMACELIRNTMGSGEWETELRREYAQVGQISELHKALVALNQRIIITTNFDKFLESAWQSCNPKATHFIQTIVGVNERAFRSLRDNTDYIIKIHGSIDDPSTIIFTKSDYTKNAYGSWAYTKFIETLLITHTFIFVGFSMQDPAVAFLIEMYALHLPDARPHYIFLAEKLTSQYTQIVKKMRRLYIIPYSDSENHAELVDLIALLGRQALARRREIMAEEWQGLTAPASQA